MKKLFENWRKYLDEKRFTDYDAEKNKWVEIPASDIQHDPENIDLTDEFFRLIDNAYSKIGGHFDFQKASDIPSDHDWWAAIDTDDDPDPDALRIGKKKSSGYKLTASGHDGSRAAKVAYLDKTADLLFNDGYFAEMSDAIAHIMITRYDVPFVGDEEKVRKALGKEITWIGPHPEGKYPGFDGWYERKIGGKHLHMKIMLGKPK
jgi:hypothetical protein